MQLLLERGADPNQKDTGGRTVLMLAAGAFPPNAAAVRFVLELGGDIQARDDAGRTALDWALTLGETEISGLLRKAGANPGLSPAPPPQRGSKLQERSRSVSEVGGGSGTPQPVIPRPERLLLLSQQQSSGGCAESGTDTWNHRRSQGRGPRCTG